MSDSDKVEAFKELALRYLDEDLNEEELSDFNEQLKSSESYRQIFLTLSGAELAWHNLLYREPQKKSMKRSDLFALCAVAAFILGIGITWFTVILNRPDSLTFKVEQKSEIAKGSMFETNELLPGKLYDLKEGSVTLAFSEGTKIELVAPVRWKCLPRYDETTFYIYEGRIESVIQKQLQAQPFIFQSDHMRNVIVGTEIMMKVRESYSEIEVIEGKVQSESTDAPGEIQELSGGVRMVMDKIGEWSRIAYASKYHALASFNERPLKDYVFKTHSRHEKLLLDIREGSQSELIDIKVSNQIGEGQKEYCYAFIKPDTLPRELKGVRFWVKGEASNTPYQFRVHHEGIHKSTELMDDSTIWKVVELVWDEFEHTERENDTVQFNANKLEFLSFSFSEDIKLSVKYFEFLK